MTGDSQDRLDTLALVEAYKKELVEYFGSRLVSVILYGSLARGEFSADSDIDLLVIAEDLPGRYRERTEILSQIETRLEPMILDFYRAGRFTEFLVIIKSLEEAVRFTPLYLDMVEDAVFLHDRDDFFRQVLNRLKERLNFYGARRIKQGKVRYWELKPDYKWGDVISLD